MAGERFGRPQRPAHLSRKAWWLISSQPGRIPYINTTPLPWLQLRPLTHWLGLAVHSSGVFGNRPKKNKQKTQNEAAPIVERVGLGSSDKQKKKKKISTNAAFHCSSSNMKNMNKLHTLGAENYDTIKDGWMIN